VDEQGRRSLLRLGYVNGFDRPVIELEGTIIGVLMNELAGDLLANFLVAASMLDPANLSRAEP
jgi:hypothetical protein